uniref:Ribosome quality control complex subunit NEMF n=1 Tax=Phallusia mammillata TaxID=59560 RepID=A0A6F9DLH2_9ASCI|nr:nuclear export mediator factor NEMF [Phallusia mammillata]
MKTRFSTLDICAVLAEINDRAIGMRLANVYDINNKTYLFKLAKPDQKVILLVESGIRMHLSEFDWPKNSMPSGFSFKLRKHLRGRRLVSATQLGIDRIIDLQFGSNEAAYHVIVELYDRGNVALTDCDYTILNLLRFRKDLTVKADPKDSDAQENEDVKFAVHEPYPVHTARPVEEFITLDRLQEVLAAARKDSVVKRVLNPVLPYGAPCLDHCLLTAGFSANAKVGLDLIIPDDVSRLHESLKEAEKFMQDAKSKKCQGYIIKKKEKKSDGELLTNIEFQPFLFKQHQDLPYQEYETFNKAVDEFFGSLESQKQDLKALQYERSALKKLDNIRKDHESRITGLQKEQEEDKVKAALIEENLDVVDQAIRIVCSAIANQVDWSEIKALVHTAQMKGDPVASLIKSLKLETNSMVMLLSERSYSASDDSDYLDSSDSEREDVKVKSKPRKVEIDLSLSAYSNAQRYYNMKRQALKKEQRTVDASTKAFKSAEKKTKQTLKEAAAVQNIQKARKVFWFEKFLWFVSSENYLVIGGRDAQQNEILVKKYLNAGDVYVHADLHGATSSIIKNPSGAPIPPKTLNEAGTMAICHSAAWDAKVVTSAWWVSHDQVTKTAPSGEYLTTGSFLIRGKKNYLPPSYLVYGFGFLFKVDETSIWRHKGERKVRAVEDDLSTLADEIDVELDLEEEIREEEEKSETASLNAKEVSEIEKVNPATNNKENGTENTDDVSSVNESTRHGVNEIKENKFNSPDISNDKQEDDIQPEANVQFEYPDTVVKMEYSNTDKYQLNEYKEQLEEADSKFVYLGDDTPVPVQSEKVPQESGKPRLSAKQKREQRKQKKNQNQEDKIEPQTQVQNKSNEGKGHVDKVIHEPEPVKRGKKNKLKKIKEKYKDQDEEERQLKMEILQSASAPRSKSKKNKNKHEQTKPKQHSGPKTTSQPKSQFIEKPVEKATENTTINLLTQPVQDKDDGVESDEEKEAVLKEEHLPLYPVVDILDSLTGCPMPDDVLLFAIPVCAPYNSMQNYKFKVKLTPGNGKKGKAAKTAISMFMSTRETNQQEKDHLRSVKDHDLSRGMPGKVKVSAPNLQKQKHKGKR